jgi:hypothetical protein
MGLAPLERIGMSKRAIIFLLTVLCAALSLHAADEAAVIVAVGAAGEEAYAQEFAKWAGDWQKAATAGKAAVQVIGAKPEEKDSLTRLRTAVEAEAKESTAPLWLVLLGHGTFDGRDGKLNLRGDDVTATEVAGWLKNAARPVVVVCGFSASGAFLKPLTAAGRVVITATKSGAENNFARFGGYLAAAIADPAADLDHDGQTSILEAWLAAASQTAEFYKGADRIATEHSLLDDNGDAFGTPPDWYSGLRLMKKPKDGKSPDGLRAGQLSLVPNAEERGFAPELRTQRDKLEADLAALHELKANLPEKEYFAKLEAILLQLARLYQKK